MKPRAIAILFLFFTLPVFSSAAASDFGVGFAAGEPTGFALCFVPGQDYAIAAVAGWSFSEPEGAHLHFDYVMGDRLGPTGRGSPIYNGIGIRFQLYDDGGKRLIGARFPMGLLFPAKHRRFDLFIEVVPMLDLEPETAFDFAGALGMRFYFGGRVT